MTHALETSQPGTSVASEPKPSVEVERLREALEEAVVTLKLLKRNVENEIRNHDGLFRWEGVPEAIQARIDQSRAALSRKQEPGVPTPGGEV
jgi:hypothetical protein